MSKAIILGTSVYTGESVELEDIGTEWSDDLSVPVLLWDDELFRSITEHRDTPYCIFGSVQASWLTCSHFDELYARLDEIWVINAAVEFYAGCGGEEDQDTFRHRRAYNDLRLMVLGLYRWLRDEYEQHCPDGWTGPVKRPEIASSAGSGDDQVFFIHDLYCRAVGFTYTELFDAVRIHCPTGGHWADMCELTTESAVGQDCAALIRSAIDLRDRCPDQLDVVDWDSLYRQMTVFLFG